MSHKPAQNHTNQETWWGYLLMIIGGTTWFLIILCLGIAFKSILETPHEAEQSPAVKQTNSTIPKTSKATVVPSQTDCWQAVPSLHFAYKYNCNQYQTVATDKQIEFWDKSEPRPTPAKKIDVCDSNIIKIYQPKTAVPSLSAWVATQTGVKKSSLPSKQGLPGQTCMADLLSEKSQLEVRQPNTPDIPSFWRFYSFLPLDAKAPIILQTNFCSTGVITCDVIEAIKSWP